MRVRINLLSRDNGVGLSTDMQLLEGILTPAGHQVRRVDWRDPQVPAADVNIHLELLNHRNLPRARHNIGIFNPEWFQPNWRRYLAHFSQLWAKSQECHDVMRKWGSRRVRLTGFASRDLYDPAILRKPHVLHLAGHSSHKNTDAVLAAWRADQEGKLPPLTVISHVPRDVPLDVRLLGHLDEQQLRRELNTHQIHLCPSRAEGWGHYITEAMSTAAVVITTDASPMNEHIRSDSGLLLKPYAVGRTHAARTYSITPAAIADAAHRARLMSEAAREKMGQAARARVLARNAEFTQAALAALKELR